MCIIIIIYSPSLQYNITSKCVTNTIFTLSGWGVFIIPLSGRLTRTRIVARLVVPPVSQRAHGADYAPKH